MAGATDTRVRTFCRLVGASDLPTWLGVPPDATPSAFKVALERKRQLLEAAMSDPASARQVELLTDHHDLLCEAIDAGEAVVRPDADHYRALGVSDSASFSEIEAAWQERVRSGDAADAHRVAWDVLGDPAARAAYDRDRHETHRSLLSGPSSGWPAWPDAAEVDEPMSAPAPGRPAWPWRWTALAAALVGVGWTVGAGARHDGPAVGPTTHGDLRQVPAIAACLDGAAPPAYVDVHTDAAGRPTGYSVGYSVGGTAADAVHACVKEALATLTFPADPHGQPAIHRYAVR